MLGSPKSAILPAVFLVVLPMLAPMNVGAQACEFCITPWMCEGGTWNRHCWIEGPPGYECVDALGCEKEGGDSEEVAAVDLRTIDTPEGPHHVSRITEHFFGQWLTCNGWVTELWMEREDGVLLPVEPGKVGLLYHPRFLVAGDSREP